MFGPLGRLGAAATNGQHCPQMTQRRCICSPYSILFKANNGTLLPLTVGDDLVGGLDDVGEDDVLAPKVLPEQLGQPRAQLAKAP